MRSFWRRHRALRILSYIVLALVLVVCVLPYLIPLGQPQVQISQDQLVSEHGRFLDIDGSRIYVEEQNPESVQATIVFIHGFGGSTFSWRHNAPFFAGQGYRIVSLDLKGFGLSYKDFASDYSHPAQARLLAEVLARLGVDEAYFVGHSMGTSVMLHFAHLYPEKILGLISVDGAVNLDKGGIFPSALLDFPPIRRAGEVLLTRYGTRERVGRILRSAYYRKDIVTAEVMDGYYNRLVNGQWAQSLLAMTRDTSENTITLALADFRFPTLILWGQNDTWVKQIDIDRWRGQIPSAEFHAIPEAGHMLMEEEPDLFNSMVLAFLQSHGE
ncbi:MAG: alpha/beta hydrolase [Dehalococcoidia bacterium]|nr:alpha/beta hydrolase [Dehalococcoidia bacterium]MDH4299469.1 alpha/beta hydrolase [Dehalococcoidia bacterium]MDH4367426.1 alpha/beta hydrolase [Dehalococcoidia bacterium]